MRKNLFFALALASASLFLSFNSWADDDINKMYDYRTCIVEGRTFELGAFMKQYANWEYGVKECCSYGSCHEDYFSTAAGEYDENGNKIAHNLASICAKYDHTSAFIWFTEYKGVPIDEWGIVAADYTASNNLKKSYVKNYTPLMYAVKNGNIAFVKYLLQKGADAQKVNRWNKTALTYAKESDNFPIISMLSKYAKLLPEEDAKLKEFNRSLLSLKGMSREELLSDLGLDFEFDFKNYI